MNNKLYRNKTLNRIDIKTKFLGSNKHLNIFTFLNIRLVITLLLFIFFLTEFKYGYFLAPLISILFYILIEFFVYDIPIRIRKKELEKDALIFFEFLALTLKTGHNLRESLTIATQNMNNELSFEIEKVLLEVNLGKSLKEALENLKKRIPSDSINNIIMNLIAANNYGTNINEDLKISLDYLKRKKILQNKIKISKIPVKIGLVYVLLYIPTIVFITLAPLLVNYLLK